MLPQAPRVTYKAVIDFPPRGSEGTFPADHNLVITTRLENPLWTYALILDGVRNPDKTVSTEQLTLSGFELNYPSNVQQSVVVIVNGTAPEVSRVTMTSIMDKSERDDAGMIIRIPRVRTARSPSIPGDDNPSTGPRQHRRAALQQLSSSRIAAACGIVHLIGKREGW